MLRIEYFDKERFMRQLSASHGSVLLHLDNGKTCDLKKGHYCTLHAADDGHCPPRRALTSP